MTVVFGCALRDVRVGGGGRRRAREQHHAREIIHRARGEIAHALEVPERAFALEAGTAGDVDPRDLRDRATAAACRPATTSRTAPPSARPTAAAACISPESLLTTIEASDRRSIAVPRSVRPVRSRMCRRRFARRLHHRFGRELVVGRADEPHLQAVGAGIVAASSAKCVGGQRFAGPNSAPGHRIATLRSVRRPQRAHRRGAIRERRARARAAAASARVRPAARQARRSGRRGAATPRWSSRRMSFSRP